MSVKPECSNNENAVSQHRNPLVDVAKGYGILLVFLGHVVYYDSPVFRVIFNMHMPLFFVLAGMVFNTSRDEGWRSFLHRQIRGIVLPFVFFTCLGVVICLFTGRLIQHSCMDWLRAGASFVHGDPYVAGSLWFLSCLFVVKTVFWTLHRKKMGNVFVLLLLATSYLLGIVCGKFINPKILLAGPLMCFSVPMALFFFSIGFYGRNVLNLLANCSKYLIMLVCVILCIAEVALAMPFATPNLAIPAFPSAWAFLPASLCGIGAVLCFSALPLPGGVIRFVGRNSLYYFLIERWVHEIRIPFLSAFMPGFANGETTLNPNVMALTPLQILISLIFSISLATLTVPLTKWALARLKTRLKIGI